MLLIWKYDERFLKLLLIKFEINFCKILYFYFFYVINKVEIGKKKNLIEMYIYLNKC